MSKSRPVEAKTIATELQRLVEADRDLTFGVIGFYSRQVQLIRERLAHLGLLERTENGWAPLGPARHNSKGERIDRVQVGTVDAFQGKQFDVVLLSLTRSSRIRHARSGTPAQTVGQRYGHIVVPNRMCVATSRQQRLLIMVGDEAMARPETAPPEAVTLTNFWRLCREHPAGRVRPAEAPHAEQ
jgi:superfamily I DNA and/or RNA helicase